MASRLADTIFFTLWIKMEKNLLRNPSLNDVQDAVPTPELNLH